MKAAAVILILLGILSLYPLQAQQNNSGNIVLVQEKFISKNQYLIVARGYPKAGLTDKTQIRGTANEAALLNAQIIARQRFKETIDVIQHGSAKKYTFNRNYADVTYVISYPGIKNYLREKKP